MKPFHPIRTCVWMATASLVTTLALTGNGLAQDFSKFEIKADRLKETTWMLVGAGGNMGLSGGEDAVFLVDDQYAPMAPKIKAAIAAITKKPVQFVMNTHFHFDHTGGNEALGKEGAISFHINGEEVQAFHVPAAHTDGDLIVHFKGGDIVHMAQRIADQRRAGKSDEQVRAAKPTADYDAVWGQGFIKPDQFVQQVLNGLPK